MDNALAHYILAAMSPADKINELDDRHVKNVKPLVPPQIIMEELPLTIEALETVAKGRNDTEAIFNNKQDRLVVIVGPCSVHDARAGIEYAKRLHEYAETAKNDLHIIMRVYFQKPRTTVGWKGLINDPNIDGSFQINKGLRLARSLLLEVANIGLPAGTEFLDTITPQYTADLVSWGAIGARTTESQVHRELTSGLSMPVGFKNGTDGSVRIAVDAIRSSSSSHHFLSVTKQGISAIVETEGNDKCHVILRGSNKGPNYHPEDITQTRTSLLEAGLPARIMIDCSHGNSEKKHENQLKAARSISDQLAMGDENAQSIMGVMLESNLVEGRQNVPPEGPNYLTYGQSITDACMGWDMTVEALDILRAGVQARRAKLPSGPSEPVNPDTIQSLDPQPGYNDGVLASLSK